MSEATIRWQAQRIEELEALLAHERSRLREDHSVADVARIMTAFKLSKLQARIVLTLYRGGGEFVSHRHIVDRMYDGRDTPGDPDNVLKACVCRIRPQLPMLTRYQLGYAFTEDSLARVAAVLNRKQGRAA